MLGAFGFGGLGKISKEGKENEENSGQNGEEEITLKQFLEIQRELELEAAAALPFKFDQCSAELGPLRQNLHICHNCPNLDKFQGRPMAFCYACAITCHNFDPEKTGFNAEIAGTAVKPSLVIPETAASIDDVFDAYGSDESSQNLSNNSNTHFIEEIWARRNFICDCPATGHCKLLKSIPDAFVSHRNSYFNEHNFEGKYCVCDGAGWSVGDRTMYQCEICEDWFHDDCVVSGSAGGTIPLEDSFNDFICKSCVQFHLKFFSKLNFKDNSFIFTSPVNLKLPAPLFLAGEWRGYLRNVAVEGDLEVSKGIGHLLRDEETVYEPPVDTEANESLYDLGLKALEQNTPRDQAILGIKMIDSLKDRLKFHLERIAGEEKRAITAEDIRCFFDGENLKKKRTKLE